MVRYRNLIEALEAAPGERPFVTAWVNEDEQETVTFAEFRRRAVRRREICALTACTAGDRVIIIMPQGIPAMTVFAGAMMIGAVPAFIAYPNDKVEPSKYRAGVAGVTANLSAKVVVIDKEFPARCSGTCRSPMSPGCFAPATEETTVGDTELARLDGCGSTAWLSYSIRRAQPGFRKASR